MEERGLVAIAGAGFAGLTLACTLLRAGRPVDFGELDHPHPFFLLVARRALLCVLADELVRLGGSRPLYGAEVDGLIRDGGAVRGVRYRREREPAQLRAWCVAGADGARSAVALGERGYFYDSVTAENRAAVEAGDLDGWRAVYATRIPYAAELTAPISSWDELSVFGARPSRAACRVADGAALLGDAAAVVHPHSAQGANLALGTGSRSASSSPGSTRRVSFDAAISPPTSAGAGARPPATSPGPG